jgi:hypothetical protein
MGKVYETISDELAAWIRAQRMFFVGTAPLAATGHVNVSPKNGDALKVLGPLEVAYQDYTGSGAETAAHIRENGRIVIMFCALDGPPKIVRLHGFARLISLDDLRFAEIYEQFASNPGTRAFIHVVVSRVSDSCGFGVPIYEFRKHRDTLTRWADRKGPEGLERYRSEKNQRSIDGLPAFDHGPNSSL